MKYICTINDFGVHEIFMFSNLIDHDVMASNITCMIKERFGKTEEILRLPVSAGFVSPDGICFGKSISLGIKCREERDTELLKAQF